MSKLNSSQIKNIVKAALAEDIGSGDVTSHAVIPYGEKIRGKIISKRSGIVAGLCIAELVFEAVDKKIKVKMKVKDGARVHPGRILAEVSGPARSILAAERVALNFLQRMSGIATATAGYVKRVRGYKVKILDTRKTAPGLRVFDKYAVKVGGGSNHRMGLYDALLIKENHIDIVGGIGRAVSQARRNAPSRMPVEVEARTFEEVQEAIEAGANTILLDNMKTATLSRAVKLVKSSGKKIKTEASGGINLGNVARIAKTGVDCISVGALTHSPKALDISLEIK